MVAAGPAAGAGAHRPVVLYNGNCPFCRATARLVARLDRGGRVAFLPFDDPEAEPFMQSIAPDERETSWHLAGAGGRSVSAGVATVELLILLPSLAWLGKTIRALRLTWLVGVLYRFVAGRRSQLSRFFSTAPGPRRFP
ncbi:MAG TPA: DUF393 domain-containing protein [Actinomycetota bacterium]|nr:DUF393 domain-containing protein [Actinomycetota bacterium]